jgi:lipoprotein-anchoring transpeptidase ErfK/SrfK
MMLRMTLLIWLVVATAVVAQSPTAPSDGNRGSHHRASPPSQVLEVQVLLDRAGFSPGEIDGRAGPNVRQALAAYQKSRDLPASGRVDEATARRLLDEAGQQPALANYTVTDADIAGPFQPDIPKDLVEQSKLGSLDYRNALEALAEKFHASPALLQSLNPGQTFMRAGEQIMVPNVESGNAPAASAPSPGSVRIVVTRRTSALTVEDGTGRVIVHAPVTTGSQHDPLPVGRWKVTGVQQSPAFHYNPDLFWDADPMHSKARIAPGPNNPVGVAWIDISKEHYGIHGTPEPSTVGHTQSHGCVRMTNWDVRRVLPWVRTGTPVIFQ